MKTTLHHTYVLLALIAGIHQAAAQGTAFTYQGRLNNGTNVATGTYNLAFTLFDASTNGNVIGHPSTNFAVTVNGGLFTVPVDFGANAFTGATNWMQIAVGTNLTGLYTNLTPRQQLTPVPYAIFAESASNVLGTVPGGGLSGNYVNPVTMNNPGNVFGGNGNLLTSLNASAFIQGTIPAFALNNAWRIVGNTNANPTNGAFLGTADNFPLEFHVNSQRGLRLEYATNADQNVTSPNQSINVIGGSSANFVNSGVVAATIGGGGVGGIPSFPNQISADYGTIGGGYGNTVSGHDASVVGGAGNTASGVGATVAGGEGNTASGALSFAAGLNAQATNNGSFVWADLSSPVNNFYSTNDNSFNVRAAGGVRFVTTGAGLNVDGPVAANSVTAGTVTATQLSGNGIGLTTLNASNLTVGLLPDARLSTNVALLNANNTFSGVQKVGSTFTVEPRPGNTGANNFFAGQSAGVANTSGIQNTFVGNFAGFDNTTGGGNSFYGYNVGSRTTIGNSETFMGNSAGFFNTIGDQNTFYGAGAGQANTNGSYNTFVGTTAGLNNLSGSNNIALGYQAGINLTTGSGNIDIGNPGVATDNNIIRIGNGQGTNVLAGNVGIGTSTPNSPLAVFGNIFMGKQRNNTVFNQIGDTIYLGAEQKYLANTLQTPVNGSTDWINLMANPLSAGIILGVSSSSTTNPHSNAVPLMVIKSNGNVGIGGGSATNPATALQVNGTITASAFSGPGAGLTGLNGANVSGVALTNVANTFFAQQTFKVPTFQFGCLMTDGTNSVGTYLSQGQCSIGTLTAHSFGIFVNNGFDSMTVNSNGNVGIGTAVPAGHLSVATAQGTVNIMDGQFTPELIMTGGSVPGDLRLRNALEIWPSTNITAAGHLDVRGTNGVADIILEGSNGNVTCVAVNITSDRNAKEDFTSLNPLDVLAKVAALPITEWQYKAEKAGAAAATRHIGPMAQDFHDAFTLGQDDKHISVVDEGGVALAAIQGLNQKLEEKDARIEQLEKTVNQLSDLVNKLALQQNGGAK